MAKVAPGPVEETRMYHNTAPGIHRVIDARDEQRATVGGPGFHQDDGGSWAKEIEREQEPKLREALGPEVKERKDTSGELWGMEYLPPRVAALIIEDRRDKAQAEIAGEAGCSQSTVSGALAFGYRCYAAITEWESHPPPLPWLRAVCELLGVEHLVTLGSRGRRFPMLCSQMIYDLITGDGVVRDLVMVEEGSDLEQPCAIDFAERQVRSALIKVIAALRGSDVALHHNLADLIFAHTKNETRGRLGDPPVEFEYDGDDVVGVVRTPHPIMPAAWREPNPANEDN